jgi:CheY-like chemotaxis protein/HPt (histidine-containing phosphotransfer) domain-containing protein
MDTALGPGRILVVDDDAVSREVFSLLLLRQGYGVETADSGEAALLHLRAMGDAPPKIILADMQMPGISGYELATQLREVCGAGTMLLAMSGSEPGLEARRSFDGFLLKPFTMDDLTAVIAGSSSKVANGANHEDGSALDEDVYKKLAASMKKEKLEQLYALCLADAQRRIGAMQLAASEGDDAAYRREAHALKGGCGMVGAVELQNLATSMEKQGLSVTNHVVTLDEFILGCDRLRRILIAHENREQQSSLSGEDAHE